MRKRRSELRFSIRHRVKTARETKRPYLDECSKHSTPSQEKRIRHGKSDKDQSLLIENNTHANLPLDVVGLLLVLLRLVCARTPIALHHWPRPWTFKGPEDHGLYRIGGHHHHCPTLHWIPV